ncbi:MAG: Holliday junction branch migration protein RuvA [Nitrosomonadaceae bacterium]|jgi:Holliday junction DNA helicase RuvA|nr:Holliday junction branch migration protein RuvA [Nitrosomonadaceae bacterium]|tara:strand:+ start:1045 stop:1629 length:585 start_codon:yes stop_codon:yes gene_type:complete
MIGRLTGLLLEKQPPLVLLDVQGVGYEVNVPMSTFYTLPDTGERIILHTYLVVREDVHLLFGFATDTERQAFRQLVKISGVGARTALAVLSGLSVSDLYQAVVDQDSRQIIQVPGIGKKTAERLLLELRDKLSSDMIGTDGHASSSKVNNDVLNALLSLGYNEREASWAIKKLSLDVTVSEGIREALKFLSKER